MSLSLEQVNKVATLAKLELTLAEAKTYGHQLSAILDYMEELRKLKVNILLTKTKDLKQIEQQEVIWRTDEVKEFENKDLLNLNKEGYLKTKRILE